MSQLALQLIAEAKRTNAKVLDLGNCGLTELPNELFELTQLEELNLCNRYWDYKKRKYIESNNQGDLNQLSRLKKGITRLKALKMLRINGDLSNKFQISDVSFLGKLTNLKSLGLSNNRLKDISVLQNLTSLKSLNLSNNRLKDVFVLKNLINIQSLYLSYNEITDISFLQNLTSIQSLYLNYNKITDYSVLQNLISIRKLDLHSNQITDISFLDNLISLQSLGLSDNKLKDISVLQNLTSLQSLNLCRNQITDISFLRNLTSLQNLDLNRNQIKDISVLQNLTSLQSLNLNENQITNISFLRSLTNLQKLDLSRNQITDISVVQKLPELLKIDFSFNQITDLPSIENLTNLQSLNLSRNQITDISVIQNLPELQKLDLVSNQITDISLLQNLPELQRLDLKRNQITDTSFYQDLPKLQRLDLSKNQITKISFLQNLPELKRLDLVSNQIADISFQQNLPELQSLNLRSNQIIDISFLQNLPRLQSLTLNSNQITDISFQQSLPELQKLHLLNNRITNVQLSFLNQLPSLSSLKLSGNPLKNIDNIIIGTPFHNCLPDLRNYLQDLEAGKTINIAIKLLFLGNGGVGKTQIAKRLVEAENYMFDSQHRSTHAICLLRKNLPSDFLPNGLDLTLWDLAGQDIYHASHRLFMQTKAIFVLVWDIDSENSPHHTYNEKQYKNKELLYWMEYIKHFSSKSPIILLQNKVDDEAISKQKLPGTTLSAYKKDYRVVKQIQVSAKTGKGFTVLQKTIINLFKKGGMLNKTVKELPCSWVTVRQKIYNDAEQGFKTIPIDHFEGYCKAEGIKKSSRSVLKFLHNTGALFYKSGYFNNQIIVDQAWAIEAIYKVLDRDGEYFQTLIDEEGDFSYDDITTIWKNNNDSERKLFIDFMLTCELCFEVTKYKKHDTPLSERHFVIPQFLPSKPASLNTYFKDFNITVVDQSRKYSFLPEAYIQRFIVNAHKFAVPDEIWKNGILLYYKSENAYAMVEADYVENYIHIQYSPNSRDLLKAINEELDKIAGEGKIKPLKLTENDPKAFGRKVIKGFKDLSPHKRDHRIMDQPKKYLFHTQNMM